MGADGVATRRRILRAAREAFASEGYERTTPATVAAAAGVGRTAMYNYFTSKADLYRGVIEDMNTTVMDELFDVEAGRRDDATARIAQVLRESARRNVEDPSYGRFLSTMLVDAFRHPDFAPLAEAEVERTRRFFRDALAATTGGADEDIVDLLVALQWGLGLFAAFMGSPARVSTMTETLIRIIDRGVSSG